MNKVHSAPSPSPKPLKVADLKAGQAFKFTSSATDDRVPQPAVYVKGNNGQSICLGGVQDGFIFSDYSFDQMDNLVITLFDLDITATRKV